MRWCDIEIISVESFQKEFVNRVHLNAWDEKCFQSFSSPKQRIYESIFENGREIGHVPD